jgi:hypothetical protein
MMGSFGWNGFTGQAAWEEVRAAPETRTARILLEDPGRSTQKIGCA